MWVEWTSMRSSREEAGVDEFLDGFEADAVDVAIDAGGVVGHFVEHLAIGVGEPLVVFEEVAVAIDVGDDELLVGELIAGEEVGVAGVGIDDHFVDFLEAVGVAFHEFIELGAEPPVGIADGEAAISGEHAEFLVIEHLEDGGEEIEAIGGGVGFHFRLDLAEVLGEDAGLADGHGESPGNYLPLPRKVLMD